MLQRTVNAIVVTACLVGCVTKQDEMAAVMAQSQEMAVANEHAEAAARERDRPRIRIVNGHAERPTGTATGSGVDEPDATGSSRAAQEAARAALAEEKSRSAIPSEPSKPTPTAAEEVAAAAWDTCFRLGYDQGAIRYFRARIKRERSNESGTVNVVDLHCWGVQIQALQDDVVARKRAYGETTGHTFIDAVCRGASRESFSNGEESGAKPETMVPCD